MEKCAELPQTKNLLKDLKLPRFGGEEKEHNKDALNKFLHKWDNIHSLRRNPKVVRSIEPSLSLTGKAYKWWMSLKEHPSSWEDLENVFKKVFPLVSELQRLWQSWNKCSMEGKALNQYILNYREIVLKLIGIDEFLILRGFMEASIPTRRRTLSQSSQNIWLKRSNTLRSMMSLIVDQAKEKESFNLKRKFFKADKGGLGSNESFRG